MAPKKRTPADENAYRIALAIGIRLCPCNKVWKLCPTHSKQSSKPRPKPYSTKVTDPKSGYYPGSLGHQQWKQDFRDKLRANPTRAEQILMSQLAGDKEWIFQPIVLGFIPDFAHERAKIILECDGAPHFTTAGKRRDARRDNVFRLKGWCVLRFSNSQIERQTDDVLSSINAYKDARLNGRDSKFIL